MLPFTRDFGKLYSRSPSGYLAFLRKTVLEFVNPIKVGCLSVRNIIKSDEAFFLSLLVRTVQQLPKIFSLCE